MNDPTPPPDGSADDTPASPWDRYEYLYENRPEGDTSTCLRPLGKCEMGDCCDVCLHNPERATVGGCGKNGPGKRGRRA